MGACDAVIQSELQQALPSLLARQDSNLQPDCYERQGNEHVRSLLIASGQFVTYGSAQVRTKNYDSVEWLPKTRISEVLNPVLAWLGRLASTDQ
jgi:hypothetical protein